MENLKRVLVDLFLYLFVIGGFIGTAYHAIHLALGAVGLIDAFGQNVPRPEITGLLIRHIPFFIFFLLMVSLAMTRLHKK